MSEFLYEDITHKIIGSAFEAYKNLRYGFLEKVYGNALVVELKLKKLKVESQKPIHISYKDKIVGDYITDIFVEDKVIVVVELKAEKEYNSRHEAQLINYLKATKLKVGLLINFGEKTCQPKRIVN